MTNPTLNYFVATNVLIEKDGKILLSLRQNTGWADNMMTIPGGHTEEGETVVQAAIREAKEELGLDLFPEDLTYLCTEKTRKVRFTNIKKPA